MADRDQQLKDVLMENKRRLWNELRVELFENLGEQYNSQFENPMDDGEQSLLDVIEDTGLSVADIRKTELTNLDQAERKLSEGTYGICEECGDEIDTERMKVVPYAIYCVRCQEAHEGPLQPRHSTI